MRSYLFLILIAVGLIACEKETFMIDAQYGRIPGNYQLSASPNPFSDSLSITYTVPPTSSPHKLRLTVHDMSQQETIVLVDSGSHQSGIYTVLWNGTYQNNKPAPAGFYYVELSGWAYSDPPICRLLIYRVVN